MPLYEFKCPVCKKRQEDLYNNADEARLDRPFCNCNGTVKPMDFVFPKPRLNFWSVDPMEMDGEKEFIDAGGYE